MRVATDIGGTFTDLVYLSEDGIGLEKVSSTPPGFERGVLRALDSAGIDESSDVWSFVHGTTVIINALTERRGSTTALVTTRGFRDVLELGRSNRPALYDLRFAKPKPFVERYLRYEVAERMAYTGDVLEPLDEVEVEEVARRARLEGVEAIAICFLHSYKNPEHERRCAEILGRVYPDAEVTMSHDVTMEWREYERTSTAVLNAYVQKTGRRYIDSLEGGLGDRGVRERLYIMQSNGGTTTFARAKATPITIIESGPVAGVRGAAVIGELIGQPNVISLDIGGTTAKTSLIEDGEVKVRTDYKVDWTPSFPGYPIKVPVVDIVEIGAGGGSIASVDDAGNIAVGPRSAGAVPGPACYPDGGVEPTVTDANLIAGRINGDQFLGGEINVSSERALEALKLVADPLGIEPGAAALGVIRMANAKMVSAIRLVSVQRGFDPRDFDIVAFGGGGSMHAATLAADLKIGRVIVPLAPAHFSAWGMLMTDLRADWVRTHVGRTDKIDLDELNGIWGELETEAQQRFDADGLPPESIRLHRFGDLRYKGQEHTVAVPIASGRLDPSDLRVLEESFHVEHERAYTVRLDAPIELVNLRLTAIGTVDKPAPPRIGLRGTAAEARKDTRTVDYDEHGRHEAGIYDRNRLGSGARLYGPAVVEEAAASTVVLPDQSLSVDEYGNLLIEIHGG